DRDERAEGRAPDQVERAELTCDGVPLLPPQKCEPKLRDRGPRLLGDLVDQKPDQEERADGGGPGQDAQAGVAEARTAATETGRRSRRLGDHEKRGPFGGNGRRRRGRMTPTPVCARSGDLRDLRLVVVDDGRRHLGEPEILAERLTISDRV